MPRLIYQRGRVVPSILDDVRARLHDLAGAIGPGFPIRLNERTVTGRPVDAIARLGDVLVSAPTDAA